MITGLLGGSLIVGIGVFVGITAGYVGGLVDDVLMRITEVACEVPLIPFAIVLVTLIGVGFIQSVAIGLLPWRGSARVRRSQVLRIYRIAGPKVEQLAEETGKIIQLMIGESGWEPAPVWRTASGASRPTRWSTSTYSSTPTPSGKPSWHTPTPAAGGDHRADGLPRQTENTITGTEALRDELGEVRERGVAFNDKERIKGSCTAGTPVVGTQDEVVAGARSRRRGGTTTGWHRRSDRLRDRRVSSPHVV